MLNVHFIIGIRVAQDPLVWQVLDLVYAFSTQTEVLHTFHWKQYGFADYVHYF